MTNPATAKTSASSATSTGINLRQLLEEMIERDASDLHVTAGERPKLRIDGDITNSRVEHVLNPKDTLQLTYSVLTENQKKRFETEDELDFSFGIQNLARFRGNCFKQRGCVSMVIRQIPFSVKTFEELGLPSVLAKLAERPRGLVLVTGPTGSGKSTTLAAMIDLINRRRRANIITIEDPIEYVHRDKSCIVSQREVGIDTNSFGSALKYAMREAPDVILIGEMRDVETMAVAMQAAETGHLVFSTVHTTSAAETMERIINMFPPHEKPQICLRMAKSLRAVISQALIPRRDEPGRIAALEIMYVTPTISKLIEDGRPSEAYQFIEEGQHFGMQTKNQALLELYKVGKISGEHALFYAGNYTEMRQMLRRVDGLAADQQKEEEAAAKKAAAAAAARARMAQPQPPSQPQPAGAVPPPQPPRPQQ
jgi:twitching motility protein PilT